MGRKTSLVLAIIAFLPVGSAKAQAGADNRSQVQGVANTTPGSKDHPVPVSAGVMAGMILHKSDPIYPENAKGVSGTVVLQATIDDKGTIAALSLVSGPDKLREAAWNAVKQWTYKPFLLNGNPVYVKTQINVNFTSRQ